MVGAILKSVVRFLARLRHFARLFGYARLLCLLLLVAMLAVRVVDPIPLEELRVRTFDGYQILKPRETTQRPVVIIDIDEKSLAQFGQWPWPRTRVADLVQRLTDLGAAAIAFDIVFAEQDRLSPAIAADTYRDLDEASRAKLRALPSNDQVLADVLRKSPVVLGESGLPRFVPQPELKLPLTGLATLGGDPRPFLLQFPGLLRNVPVLEEAAPGRGLFTIRTERDGIVRRVPMIMLAQGELMPSLTFEMLRIVTKSDTILVKSDEAGVKSVAVPGFEIPTDRNGQLWVHFARHDAARYVSAADVLDGKIGPDRISRKLILIGTSAVGLLDVKTTPLDPVMPGVEVHAQVLESALTRSVLSQPNYAVGAELLAAILFGIAIIWLAPILSAIMLLLFGAVIVSIMVATSWYFFAEHRLLIDFTFPLIASTAIYLVLVFSSYFREQAQRRRIRSAFGQYLSPALVEQLAQSPEKLVLGGEERSMTIMFSDVRGFTAISEQFKQDPQGLTSLMNRFLTPLTNAILDRKGTIDKYMGDAIMAFWGAPLDDPQHAAHALAAAMEMPRALRALDEPFAKRGWPRLRIGVGLSTGIMRVGNMGSEFRRAYTVMGDSVNVGSRVEGLTKEYGSAVICSEATRNAGPDDWSYRELDHVRVKGKDEPVAIYEPMGPKAALPADLRQDLARHRGALKMYRAQQWDAAEAEFFSLSRGAHPHRAYELFMERIAYYRKNPPGVSWDGVFTFKTK